MFLPGLVSITFRQLSVTEIIALVTQAGLAAVEWGGDIHAPHGDEAQAQAIARMGADAGLRVAAYGSYYRVGHPETGPFEAVLASAVALGAPHIRVWPGSQGSDSADEAYFQKVVADSRRIGDLAQAERIGIVYEFHANTLTDTNAAAVRLLQTVDHANVRSLWQPPRYAAPADNLAGVEALRPWLEYLHVFHWHLQTGERRPLAEGEDLWRDYLAQARTPNARATRCWSSFRTTRRRPSCAMPRRCCNGSATILTRATDHDAWPTSASTPPPTRTVLAPSLRS